MPGSKFRGQGLEVRVDPPTAVATLLEILKPCVPAGCARRRSRHVASSSRSVDLGKWQSARCAELDISEQPRWWSFRWTLTTAAAAKEEPGGFADHAGLGPSGVAEVGFHAPPEGVLGQVAAEHGLVESLQLEQGERLVQQSAGVRHVPVLGPKSFHREGDDAVVVER